MMPPVAVENERDEEQLPPQERQPRFLESTRGQWFAGAVIFLYACCILLFAVHYVKLAHRVDRRLAAGPFSNTINIYTAPQEVAPGDALTVDDLVLRLRASGYSEARGNPMGWYHVRDHAAVEIFPGRASFSGGDPAVLEFSGGKVSRIFSLRDNTERDEFDLEPRLIANFSENREKRRLVRFADIPANLVHAVISAEDKRFFHHSGFDVLRMMKAAYVDVKTGRKEQGASTITMQLARNLWLEPDKNWRRKLQEFLITMHLEERLTKQQIFEDYANQVYLGRRGTFSINGFGEGARAYFGKDLSQLTTDEAALLGGMVQRPSYYNPQRFPERARQRRDVVLALMRQNGYLSETQYRNAVAAPLTLAPQQNGSAASQFFFDVVNNELQSKLGERERNIRYVYTTLDPELQQAAEQAVETGMAEIDRELRRRKPRGGLPAGEPQVALVALDPHTGEVKALVGGRNYAMNQMNHALALRQPGSVFKPFVYAAALNTGIEGDADIFTPASILDDEPTTFLFDNKTYAPGNFRQDFMGNVTLRTALAHSLNVATVSLAQQVGYDQVVDVARRAGLNDGIKPTPAVALGAYETTPLEIAGAYTAFDNGGMRLTPATLSLVRSGSGASIYTHTPDPRKALDPRVAYLMVNMMQDVLRYGTGAGVRSRGFTLPAAGKTGTSRDGWFAGFTTQLICVVWVGFDDNRELGLEGAHSALPIWTEFMKRAAKLRAYRDAGQFQRPPGLITEQICEDSGQIAAPNCPNTREEWFIKGTEPVEQCSLHSLPTPQ